MKRIAYWTLPLLLISVTTQASAQTGQGQAQPSTESPCLMLLNQQKYTESIAECQKALKLNPKDGFAWYWIGLSHKAALIDLAMKYSIAVDNYLANRGGPSQDNLRAAMQDAEKLAVDKRNEMVDAFAKAAAIGGEARKRAQNEMLKVLTPEEMNKIIQERNQSRD